MGIVTSRNTRTSAAHRRSIRNRSPWATRHPASWAAAPRPAPSQMLSRAPKLGPGNPHIRPAATSVQMGFPVARHAAGRPRHGLLERVVHGGCERRTFDRFLAGVVPEPVLAGLIALRDRMSGG